MNSTESHTGDHDPAKARITLGLLSAVEGDRAVTQRGIASELGIAVGLVNAYLKRCVSKGLIKVQQVPKRRYAYYLTPKGFAEKSRLTASYLLYSFDFFRQARASCEAALAEAEARNWSTLVLVGRSDLAEVAIVCALHSPVRVVALVDEECGQTFAGLRGATSLDEVAEPFDGALITDIVQAQTAYNTATSVLGAARVLVPDVLSGAIAKPHPGGAV